jgi:transposase InsO family protein
VVRDHGAEYVNRDLAAVIKAHNLLDIRTRRRHPESNGIAERFNGTVREETGDDYGANYLEAEATIARLVTDYNEQRLHAAWDTCSRRCDIWAFRRRGGSSA